MDRIKYLKSMLGLEVMGGMMMAAYVMVAVAMYLQYVRPY